MSLKNVLHEAVIPFGMGWEVRTRPPVAYRKYGGCLEAKLLGDGGLGSKRGVRHPERRRPALLGGLGATASGLRAGSTHPGFFFFFMEHHFYFKELTDKLWLHRLGCLADIFSKMNEMSLSLQQNNWWCLLPVIKFRVSSENSSFWKTCVCQILGIWEHPNI